MNGVVYRRTMAEAGRSIGMLALGTGLFYYLVMFSGSTFLSERGASVFVHPPRAITAFLNGTGDLTTPNGWLSAAMNHPITLVLGIAAGLAVAANAVATEVERGTIDLVLTRPIGRIPFLTGKAAAALTAVTAVGVAGFVGVMIARATIGRVSELPLGGTIKAFGVYWILLAGLAMVGVLGSAATGLRGRAIGTAIGLFVGWYFVNFIALLIDGVSWLRFASPFHYFNPTAAVSGGRLSIDAGVLGALALFALGTALGVFRARDLAR
ncbi:MAG: ABC transporter permease subunit [Actinomycetota bacterium]